MVLSAAGPRAGSYTTSSIPLRRTGQRVVAPRCPTYRTSLGGSVAALLDRMLALGIALVAAVALAAGSASSAVARGFAHAGRWITDPSGRVVVMHGLNMVAKRPPYEPAAVGFGSDDAAFLESLGFNVVRLGVIWKAVEPSPGVYDDTYLERIAATVRTLYAHGVLSLLDFHQDQYNELFQGEGAPDWAVQSGGLANPHDGFPTDYVADAALQHAEDAFWANAPGPGGVGLQDRYAAAWRHVALRFRATPGVVGYELMNEPAPGAAFATCLLATGCPGFDAELLAFHRRVTRAIRGVDRRTLLFYEPDIGFDFGTPAHEPALGDPQAVFAFHVYCLSDGPGGCSSEARNFPNALAHDRLTGDALMITEFGSRYASEDSRIVGLADRSMIPWAEWAYCPCDDPTGPTRDPLVLNPALPPRGANVGAVALHTLVEPFPHLIAGTPLVWGYTASSGTFRLRFSTARTAGGGRFPAGAVTQISTPAEIYHGSYAVRVQGGAIVSGRDAPVLEVVACHGAGTVTVTVQRHGRGSESCTPPRRG